MTAQIIPFPTKRRHQAQVPDYRLVPLNPVHTEEGGIWTVRLEFTSCGQAGGKPDLPAA